MGRRALEGILKELLVAGDPARGMLPSYIATAPYPPLHIAYTARSSPSRAAHPETNDYDERFGHTHMARSAYTSATKDVFPPCAR